MKAPRPYLVCATGAMLGLLLIPFIPVWAQNTKGDQPLRSGRETRLKTRPAARQQGPFGPRILSFRKKSTMAERQLTRVKKPTRPAMEVREPGQEKAWKGNVAGNRVAVRSATPQTRNLYPQRGRFVHNPSVKPDDPQLRWRAVKATRVVVRSATARTRNVYPQTGRYVHNPSRSPRPSGQRIVSNASVIARNLASASLEEPPRQKRRVVPATASRPFITRKSINPYAGFWNRKQKGERAFTGDIAGRKLRTRNYQSPRPKIEKPSGTPYYGRGRPEDRPYKGPAAGGYVSATRPGRAWRGDIAGRKIRGRNFTSKRFVQQAGLPVGALPDKRAPSGDRPFRGSAPGGAYKSFTRPGDKRVELMPLPGRPPGIGARRIDTWSGNIRGRKVFADQGEEFAGTIRARRPGKGGGSISGRMWNNNLQPISGKAPGIGARRIDTWSGNIRGRKVFADQGEEFAGTVRVRRLEKGGGSISGRMWNNNLQPISGKAPGIGARRIDTWSGNIRGRKVFADQGEEFAGTVRVRRLEKGGGSISGRMWNNNLQPISGKAPGIGARRIDTWSGNIRGRKVFADQGEEFAGTVRVRKPEKGGGSISGRLWNNNQQPISGKVPGIGARKIDTFAGNLKARRPERGGGSISGQLWNNRERPIDVKSPGEVPGNYPGGYRKFDFYPSMRDQGEEFTGYVRLSRFRRNFVPNPNQADEAMKKSRPDRSAYQVNYLQVKVRRQPYVEHGHTHDEALRKLKPSQYNQQIAGLQVRVKQSDYKSRPHSVDESLPGIAPDKASVRASEFSRAVRRDWDYRHNPSSSQAALDIKEPGKAFARATDYQGNIRMKKFGWWDKTHLHPDASYVQPNRNNVKEEKDVITSIRLWWDKNFRKADTQPSHLKEKIRKPRFDKREIGLWYD